jgi:hypothetical protein
VLWRIFKKCKEKLIQDSSQCDIWTVRIAAQPADLEPNMNEYQNIKCG